MDVHAMHIANGIVNGPVSAIFAVFAVVGAGLLRVARPAPTSTTGWRRWPGLVAAFIFAVQMLNFQVLPGVSGHLLGGTLAVILVGPWVGALCVSTVLIVQCLLFADGGLTALGLNITNMALLGTAAGYLLVAGLLRLLPQDPGRARRHRLHRLGRQRGGRLAGLRPRVRARRHHRRCRCRRSPGRWPACTC